eukprot:s569_g21.t1
MRFFVAFAALARWLALPRVTLGSHSDRCPCIGNHPDLAKQKLEHSGSCHDQFGIGCNTHNISAACAVHVYESNAAEQLECDPFSESPWCKTEWCYVDPKNCGVDWDWGVLGPYSYATCGNLRQGTAEYFQKSLAAFLQNDSLRVFHVESGLVGGYLGNTECRRDEKYSPQQNCQGRVAEFWARSLDELNKSQVQVDHTIIRRGEKGIDQYFIGSNITNQFEEYKRRFPKEWSGRPSTNFDLCAFATGMGYVDLCSGAFALTHRRQAMTFMIELYTSPVFMVSESKCDFFASNNGKKFWAWWVFVFSPGAWGFFVGVVFFFIVAMKGLDKCLDKEPEEPEELEEPDQSQQSATDKIRKCFYCLTHGIADALFGVFEAFAFKSKTSHRRDSNKPSRSRPSHMLRLGLGFFILLSTTVYGAGITANMVKTKEMKGEVPSLEEAKRRPNQVTVCTHSVFEESLKPHWNDKILPKYLDTWEEVWEKLNDKNCTAALLEEEAWNAFRSRGKLCDFYKEPTAEFYVPTGVVVSKRAYRTLETFRYAPSETVFFFNKSRVPGHVCPANSADALCANIKEEGVPWYTLFSLFLVAAACGLCSLCGIAHQHIGGEDKENEEDKKNMKDKAEMNIAIMAEIRSLLDLEFGKISKVLQQSNLPQVDAADAAGSNAEATQVDVESSRKSLMLSTFEHSEGSTDSTLLKFVSEGAHDWQNGLTCTLRSGRGRHLALLFRLQEEVQQGLEKDAVPAAGDLGVVTVLATQDSDLSKSRLWVAFDPCLKPNEKTDVGPQCSGRTMQISAIKLRPWADAEVKYMLSVS